MKLITAFPGILLLATLQLVPTTLAGEKAVLQPGQVAEALASAPPGTEIFLANGVYSNVTLRLMATGLVQKPITLRAETPNQVIFTGRSAFAISAEHIVLRDFVFDGCKVANKSILLLENAWGCRITACAFTNSIGRKNDQVIRVSSKSIDNRVDHCWFVGNAARAVQIHVETNWQTAGYPIGTRIDHNCFQDVPTEKHGQGAANGRETIQAGQGGSAECRPRTIVEYNIFLRCNGENECISNKTSENVYRYNLFKDQVGCMSLRGAGTCLVEGNRFENTPGIHVQGKGHTIINNVVIRSGGTRKPGNQSVAGSIVLGYGMPLRPDSPYPQHYKPAENCLVANNTIVDPPLYGLMVGGGKNQNWRTKGVRNVAPSKNRIVNNLVVGQTGELMMVDAAPENVVERNLILAGPQAKVSFYGENPLKAAPLFMNAESGDYRLAPGSPGLKAGIAIPEVPNSANIGAAAKPVQYGPEAAD